MMPKTSLQSAKESLENIYNHGGQNAPFLKQLRKDIDNLLRSLAHSFCLKEPGQRMELPRGWELIVTDECNIHAQHRYNGGLEHKKQKCITLILQKHVRRDSHEFREYSQRMSQVWSCGLSHDPPDYGWMTREEIFQFTDEIKTGWLDEMANQLLEFRTNDLDLDAIRFFANTE